MRVWIMKPELQAMVEQYYLSRAFVCITWPVYCTAIGGSSGHVVRTYILHVYVLV